MEIGAFFYATELGASPAFAARAAEDAGLESIFVCEHSHVPAPPAVYVDPDGKVLPDYYSHLMDPLIALAAMAAVTDRIVLGTAVCVIAERDPVMTAKEVATLDQISGGRVVFGVGTGWNDDELRGHGVEPATRFAVFKQKTETVRALWTSSSVELPPPALSRAPVAVWPRPLQQPHPPVLVAGNGPRAIRRVAEYGDGWLVTFKHPDLGAAMAEIGELRERTGRPYPVTMVAGRVAVDTLQRFADLGVDRALLAVVPGPEDVTRQRLEEIARVGEQLVRAPAAGT